MKTKFLKINNPLLRKKSKAILTNEATSKQTLFIIRKMLKIAFGEKQDQTKPVMVGLAAPQIGILKRIILVDLAADGKGLPAGRQGKVCDLRIYINPEIIWSSETKGEWYEGCYSTGKICGIVKRPTVIKITAFTMQPRGLSLSFSGHVEEKWEGYIARIFQHEIDHLNGILFIDHIKNPNHIHKVKPNEFPLYRNKEGWRNWPKKYPLPLASRKLKKV